MRIRPEWRRLESILLELTGQNTFDCRDCDPYPFSFNTEEVYNGGRLISPYPEYNAPIHVQEAFRHCAVVSTTHFKFPISAPFSPTPFLPDHPPPPPHRRVPEFFLFFSFFSCNTPSLPPLFPPSSHGRPLPFLSVRTTEYAPLVFGYSHATRADTLPPHSNPCSLSYEIVMCFPSQLRYDISHLVYDLSSP